MLTITVCYIGSGISATRNRKSLGTRYQAHQPISIEPILARRRDTLVLHSRYLAFSVR